MHDDGGAVEDGAGTDATPLEYQARSSSMNKTSSIGSLEYLIGLDDMRLPSSSSMENMVNGSYSWGGSSLGFDWPSMPNFQSSNTQAQGQYQIKVEDSSTACIPQVYARGPPEVLPEAKAMQATMDAIALANQHQHQLQLYQQHQLQQQYGVAVVPVESGVKKVDPSLPRNSSIDNFWLLVDIGDLPQPGTNVLSEHLFNIPDQSKRLATDGTAPLSSTAGISSFSSSSTANGQQMIGLSHTTLVESVLETENSKIGENYQSQYNRFSHYNPYQNETLISGSETSPPQNELSPDPDHDSAVLKRKAEMQASMESVKAPRSDNT